MKLHVDDHTEHTNVIIVQDGSIVRQLYLDKDQRFLVLPNLVCYVYNAYLILVIAGFAF